jgi:ribosomal-protein-serine acetyltransferase
MLIRHAEDGIELHLLERRHVAALQGMDPGDLGFSQGEWLFPAGGCGGWIDASLAEFAQGTRLESVVFRDGAFTGVIGLHSINSRASSASIDYCMDGRYRNQGIMTRACRALVTYAYAELGLNRLVIGPDTANLPSRRVPEKLDFSMEGVARAAYRAESGFRDCAIYSMLREDWMRRASP